MDGNRMTQSASPSETILNAEEGSWAPGRCRLCNEPLPRPFLDLGNQPLCESFLDRDHINRMEPFYPLTVYVCRKCLLVQLEAYVSPEHIFTEYAYFSSYSDTWLKHVQMYVQDAVGRFDLNSESFVVELASNDGYLLQYFARYGVPVMGIEPAANVASVAMEKGIPTLVRFFGTQTARDLAAKGRLADLIIGNNVLAQVPELHDFVEGMRTLLKASGSITMEFPHLMRLLEGNQFDTIYHEHFSYFSLVSVERLFADHQMKLFDVEELPTHGGSLRIYACHAKDPRRESESLQKLRASEQAAGLDRIETYGAFAERVKETKRKLLDFLIRAKREGKQIAGYGAPGKGNTLLNYCGIRTDFLDYVVDRNPYKQGRFLPGTHVPIYHPDRIRQTMPDYVLILPWNVKDEIIAQNSFIRSWGGQFVVPIPEVQVC
jgi:hypothetical protein